MMLYAAIDTELRPPKIKRAVSSQIPKSFYQYPRISVPFPHSPRLSPSCYNKNLNREK